MNMHIALRDRSRASWSFGHSAFWWLGMVVLLVLGWRLAFPPTANISASAVEVQPLVHFRDASHDWLMVVDATTRELVVYDATSGRPLHRLGAEEGLSGVRSIARQGSRLLVTSDQHPAGRALKLPEFQPVALNGR